jgi:hypothetical protein
MQAPPACTARLYASSTSPACAFSDVSAMRVVSHTLWLLWQIMPCLRSSECSDPQVSFFVSGL